MGERTFAKAIIPFAWLVVTTGLGGCTPPDCSTFNAPPASHPEAVIAVRKVKDLSDGATAEAVVQGDTLLVKVVSPSGIGSVELDLTGGRWPTRVGVQLAYSNDRAFTRLEGAGASMLEGEQQPEHLTVQKPESHGASGFQLRIPQTTKKVLHLYWIDVYR